MTPVTREKFADELRDRLLIFLYSTDWTLLPKDLYIRWINELWERL